MELTDEGRELGREFRRQANFFLRQFNDGVLANDRETGRDADIAILSLLAAIMAYIDPEYKPENNGH